MRNQKKSFRTDVEFYRKTYLSGKTPWPSDMPEKVFVRFLERIQKQYREKNILCVDIGCGEGRHMKMLKELFPKATVVGFDIIREPIKSAVRKIGKKKNVFFILANTFFIPIRNESADIVIDFGVFHHIRKKDAGYYKNEVNRILKRNGFFLVGVFSENFKHHPDEQRSKDFIFHREHYDRFFTPKTLEQEFPFLEKLEVCEEGAGIEFFVYGIFRKN